MSHEKIRALKAEIKQLREVRKFDHELWSECLDSNETLQAENKKLKGFIIKLVSVPRDNSSAPETWFSERARQLFEELGE